jgi:hypothetical protein
MHVRTTNIYYLIIFSIDLQEIFYQKYLTESSKIQAAVLYSPTNMYPIYSCMPKENTKIIKQLSL